MMGAYLRRDRETVKEDLERVYGYFPGCGNGSIRPPDSSRAANSKCWRSDARSINRPTLLLLDEPSLGFRQFW